MGRTVLRGPSLSSRLNDDSQPLAELFAGAGSQAVAAAGAQPSAASVDRSCERTVLRQPMSSC